MDDDDEKIEIEDREPLKVWALFELRSKSVWMKEQGANPTPLS